jgi:hypothetical protein
MEGHAGADRETLHRRDRDLGHVLPRLAQTHAAVRSVAQGDVALRRLPRRGILQIDACGERRRRAGQHDGVRLEIVLELARDLRQFQDRRLIEGIEAAAPVEFHHRDGAAAFDRDVFIAHGVVSRYRGWRYVGTPVHASATSRRHAIW